MSNLVVIGGVAAGMSAASAARRISPDAKIISIERGEFVSYASCGIPYYLSGLVKTHDNLVAITSEEFRKKRNIDVRTMQEVESIDISAKTLKIRNLKTRKSNVIEWDKLIIATGAHAEIPKIERIDAQNVFCVRSLADGVKIRSFIRDREPKRATIIGAGYAGLELAESFRTRGMVVSVVQRSDRIMRGLEPEIGGAVEDELENHGVVLQKRTHIKSLECNSTGEVRKVITADDEIETDMLIVSTGVRPTVGLAKRAGVALGKTGAIAVNDRMETNLPDVYAAGDCAEAWHRVLKKPVYIPLGTTSNKQGRVAGTNAAGSDEKFPGIVGSSVAKVFDLAVARTGIGMKEAAEAGLDVASTTITAGSKAHYYPGSKPITLTLIVENGTGKLLGAQMTGADGVAKRNDVLATAITAGLTVDEIEYLDLCYAPPYSPVYDPILIAARQASKK